jgi:predicted nucleic acid-binding protein
MKYVLDASVAIKWILPETDSEKALLLQDDFVAGRHELIAPDTFVIEVAHSLTRSERRGLMKFKHAPEHVASILKSGPVLYSYLPLVSRAVELSCEARIGVYDCLYAALAERENCELITADERLATSLAGFPILRLASL